MWNDINREQKNARREGVRGTVEESFAPPPSPGRDYRAEIFTQVEKTDSHTQSVLGLV